MRSLMKMFQVLLIGVVAGAIGLWPNASVSWMLPVWVLASSLCGLGLGPVRRLARSTLRRAWTSAADDPYAALARTVGLGRELVFDEEFSRQVKETGGAEPEAGNVDRPA